MAGAQGGCKRRKGELRPWSCRRKDSAESEETVGRACYVDSRFAARRNHLRVSARRQT